MVVVVVVLPGGGVVVVVVVLLAGTFVVIPFLLPFNVLPITTTINDNTIKPKSNLNTPFFLLCDGVCDTKARASLCLVVW